MKENKEFDKVKKLLEDVSKYDISIETMQKEINYWRYQEDFDSNMHIETLKKEIKNMQETKLKVADIINKLSDYFGRVIFTKRYLLHEKWEVITNSLGGMSERNARYIHDKSMIEFVELLKGSQHDFMESSCLLSR